MSKNTITINGNIYNSVIQQNTKNSNSTINSNAIDFDKIYSIMRNVNDLTKTEMFSKEFNTKTAEITLLIDKALFLSQKKENANELNSIIDKIKSFCLNVGSGIISSGIYETLSKI